ncbi:MAG: heavy-metal-associated domain-containing protein [Gammaproteobacteria bacterium]|nr:heavy-metal-associated domain-containing protein [Gammaproteobacteria bacterium]
MSTVNTATVIHIDETLSDDQLEFVERKLSDAPGVIAACVHKKARHLMVVDYDPNYVSSGSLLNTVQTQGLHAELVGGI